MHTAGSPVSQERASERLMLVEELRGRVRAGDVAIGQRLEVGGERFRIEPFDPIGEGVRHVYVRTQRREHLAVEIPTA